MYKVFLLPPAEYSKICSEINTNYKKYEAHHYAVHISYGIDNRAYRYYFVNNGYNDYLIYNRVEVRR